MKRFVTALSVTTFGVAVAVLPIVASPASAAVVTCKTTKAVGHAPKTITVPKKIAVGRTGKFTLVTNCGNIVITTYGKLAPVTMTSLTALAKAKYFDASLCHRLTTSGLFVLQCGDPSATGSAAGDVQRRPVRQSRSAGTGRSRRAAAQQPRRKRDPGARTRRCLRLAATSASA